MTEKSVIHIRINPEKITGSAAVAELAQVKKALVEGHCVLLAPSSYCEPHKPYIISPAALRRLTDKVLIAGWALMFASGALLFAPEFLLGMPIAACVGGIFGYALNKLERKSAEDVR